jgi:hypothetical protein
MTEKELDRYTLVKNVNNKILKQKEAAQILGISTRQFRNLQYQVQKEGSVGIISKHRDTGGNHKKPKKLKETIMALIRERYEDCGPTFIVEKLREWHKISISEETIRLWMIENHLWTPRKSRKTTHLPRLRRECFGELIQTDGSPHHWFGNDFPEATATVMIDDATSTLTAVHFSKEETTDGYFAVLEAHIKKYGIPRVLYTDKYSVFKTPTGNGTTQVRRALEELGVELIYANSPQAKGRVERVNRTLQDRLTKEFRLRGITTIEQANAFMREYLEIHNNKFSKKPKSNFDAHRPLGENDLERILSHCEVRTLCLSGSFQYTNKFFIVQGVLEKHRLKGKKIKIYKRLGKYRFFLDEKEVQVRLLEECETSPELTRKEVYLHEIKKHEPKPMSHPWKRYSYQEVVKRKELNNRIMV